MPTAQVPCSNTANIGERKTWTQIEFCSWQNSVRGQEPRKYAYTVPAKETAKHCAKFGWPPLSDVGAVTKPRRKTRWNLLGCPKLTNISQPLVGRSSPYCRDTWRRYCNLTIFGRPFLNGSPYAIGPLFVCLSCLYSDQPCLSVTLVHCGQTVRWIKMKLGMQVVWPRTHCVKWGPSSSSSKGAQSPLFGPYLLWPKGCMDQDATWRGGRPQFWGLCFRWRPSPLPKKGAEPPIFGPMSIAAKRLHGSRCHLVRM